MRRVNLFFVALLLFVSVSQIGATGFAPNMFVAQKQLNQPSSAQAQPQKDVPPVPPTPPAAPKKTTPSEKEGTKDIFRFHEKKLRPEMSDTNLEIIEVDSLVSSMCKSVLQWILVYVISLV